MPPKAPDDPIIDYGDLPVPQVIENFIQRIGGTRIKAPSPLFYVDKDKSIRRVRAFIVTVSQDEPHPIECVVRDISNEGLGIETDADLTDGDIVQVVVECSNSSERLFEDTFQIQRKTNLAGRAGRFQYGFRSEDMANSPLYRAILDSIFIGHLIHSGSLDSFKLAF